MIDAEQFHTRHIWRIQGLEKASTSATGPTIKSYSGVLFFLLWPAFLFFPVTASCIPQSESECPEYEDIPSGDLISSSAGQDFASHTLGLPMLETTESHLYRAETGPMKYCHHPQISEFKGMLYAMWSTGPTDEDGPGQHVVYSRSQDGLTWSEPQILVNDEDGVNGPRRSTAGGFWSNGDVLVAYCSTYYGSYLDRPTSGTKWTAPLQLEALTSTDGINWNEPVGVVSDFLINEPPRSLDSCRLVMTGEDHIGNTRILLSFDAQGLNWQDAYLPPPDLPVFPNEATWFKRASGELVALFRDDNRSRRLYQASSVDGGKTYSMPRITTFIDATAKSRAGTLPDGSTFVISNPRIPRNPLVMSISFDGVTFDRAFAVKADPNNSDWYAYPGCALVGEFFFIIFSVNTQDILVTRFKWRALVG